MCLDCPKEKEIIILKSKIKNLIKSIDRIIIINKIVIDNNTVSNTAREGLIEFNEMLKKDIELNKI